MLCVLLRGTNKSSDLFVESSRDTSTLNVMASKELDPFCGLKLFLGTFEK